MTKYLNSIKYLTITLVILALTNISVNAIGQDTLSGDYNTLVIKSGLHIIKESVIVKGKLEIQAGAKIEFTDPGVLICEGEVIVIGNINNKIEMYGKSKLEGIGLVIRGLDNNTNSKIDYIVRIENGVITEWRDCTTGNTITS